jgi:hypothetical protein
MYIPIETKETYNGNQYIMKAGLVKGRNNLLKNGWNTGSYNRFLKCWTFDNHILNQRDVNHTETESTLKGLGWIK